MKNYLAFIAIGLLFALNACSDDAKMKNSQEEIAKPQNGLTLEEAKAYFEQSTLKNLNSRAASEEAVSCLATGDFTPLWKQAQESYDTQASNFDIPILPEFKHKAFRTYKSKAYTTKIEQKLIVSKNLKTNKISSYILTLIPDMGNTGAYINKFVTKADKGKFSGWAISSIPQVNIPLTADYYKDGEREIHIIIPKINGKRSGKSSAFYNFMNREYQFAAYRSTQSRSWGEDDGYDSFGDWFMDEIWPNAEDGDKFEMKYDEEEGWFLEKVEEEEDIDYGFGIKIYHRACGTYLGFMLMDDWENTVMYCPTCKKYVLVMF